MKEDVAYHARTMDLKGGFCSRCGCSYSSLIRNIGDTCGDQSGGINTSAPCNGIIEDVTYSDEVRRRQQASWSQATYRRDHHLKCHPGPFAALKRGDKRHEIRVNDRAFTVGDILHLREWDPSPEGTNPIPRGYTGDSLSATVTYITEGGTWGLPPNICVMSLGPVT